MIKDIFRTIGAFLYSAIIAVAIGYFSVLVLQKILINAHGFWLCASCVVGMVIVLSWIGEHGITLLSIPFNWLWSGKVSRIISMVPPIIVGIWVGHAPFDQGLIHSGGDIVIAAIWGIVNLVTFYNLITLPIMNPEMGIQKD